MRAIAATRFRAAATGLTATLAIVLSGPAALAQQDRPVTTVLGLVSEGADPADTLLAENMTSVLRRAVEESSRVRHSGREATLVQMSLAFGCENPRERTCLQQIGAELQSRYLVGGSIDRVTSGSDWIYRVEVWAFDVQAGTEMRATSARVGRARNEYDQLRELGRTLVTRLLAGETGGLVVEAEQDGAEVRIDGEVVGVVAGGTLEVADVVAGERRIEVRADGYELYETTATVRAGRTERVRVHLVASGGGRGSSARSGIGPLQWVGIGALVVGAVLGVIAIAWAADVDSVNGSAAWREYLYRIRTYDPNASSACDADTSRIPEGTEFNGVFEQHGGEWELGGVGVPTRIPNEPQFEGRDEEEIATSDETTRHYSGGKPDVVLSRDDVDGVCLHVTGQWILGGIALAAGIVGTYLVFGTGGSDDPEESDGDATAVRLRLAPIVTSEQRGLGLHLTF